MEHPETRNNKLNHGAIVDLNTPDDRYIVGGAFILMDDAGEYSVYFPNKSAAFGRPSSPMPDDEVLLDLAAMLRAAWAIAAL